MGELALHYERYGWVAVPVLNESEVASLRRRLEEYWNLYTGEFGRRGIRCLPCSVCHWLPEVYSLQFHPVAVSAMKEVFGDGCMIFTGLEYHRNRFTLGASRAGRGWHCDSGAEGKVDYLTKSDYGFAKCGIFLQDHDPRWGGTIEVVSGGHRFPISFGGTEFRFKAKRAVNLIGERYHPTLLRLKPGTLVIFDSRLPHRSSMPGIEANLDEQRNVAHEIPEGKTKLVIYWNAGRLKYSEYYNATVTRRAHEEMRPSEEYPFFSDYLRMQYPENFPPELVGMAARAGISINVPLREMTLDIAKRFEAYVATNPAFSSWSKAWQKPPSRVDRASEVAAMQDVV